MIRYAIRVIAPVLCAMPVAGQTVTQVPSGTTALLQSISAPDQNVIWVGGHSGLLLRSTDGGRSWQQHQVAGGDTLQFRDVHALDDVTAWALSAGPGPLSRIYATSDGGQNWTRQFINADSTAFYDCLTFFDRRTGVAYSDSEGDRTRILRTTDGGENWQLLPESAVPAALEGEGAFAASGGCVVSSDNRHGWVALGAPAARLFRSTDAGASWQVHSTPVVSGEGAGLTAVSFRDSMHGIGVAADMSGNYRADTASAAVALTDDGGLTWRLVSRPARPGSLFGVTWLAGVDSLSALAVGPGGLFLTRDLGRSWTTLDERPFWSVASYGNTAWAVGPGGVILRIEF